MVALGATRIRLRRWRISDVCSRTHTRTMSVAPCSTKPLWIDITARYTWSNNGLHRWNGKLSAPLHALHAEIGHGHSGLKSGQSTTRAIHVTLSPRNDRQQGLYKVVVARYAAFNNALCWTFDSGHSRRYGAARYCQSLLLVCWRESDIRRMLIMYSIRRLSSKKACVYYKYPRWPLVRLHYLPHSECHY